MPKSKQKEGLFRRSNHHCMNVYLLIHWQEHTPLGLSCCLRLAFVQPTVQTYRGHPLCALLHRARRSETETRSKRNMIICRISSAKLFPFVLFWFERRKVGRCPYPQPALVDVFGPSRRVFDLLAEDEWQLEQEEVSVPPLSDQRFWLPNQEGVLQQELALNIQTILHTCKIQDSEEPPRHFCQVLLLVFNLKSLYITLQKSWATPPCFLLTKMWNRCSDLLEHVQTHMQIQLLRF